MGNFEDPSLFTAADAPKAMTLADYAAGIARAIAMEPRLRGAWVTAETMDLRVSGGHCYMELIEKDDRGQTVAKMRAMIWRSNLDRLRYKFYQATGRDIANGLKVMVRLTASMHPVFGLSASIDDIDPNYTLGDFERLRREILEKLQREGVLDANKRVAMPAVAQRIAVISSSTAAGYQDFMNQLEQNAGGYVFYTKLFNATMQGTQTSASVRQALQQIEMVIDLFDCVVIIRGGGSTSDMNGFDDYDLARAVATYPLPVVVGIGHERDNCVLDYIANTRCKTPTAVAAFLIDKADQAWKRAMTTMQQIARYASERLEGDKRMLSQYQTLATTLAEGRLERERLRLAHIREALPLSVSRLTIQASSRLDADMKLISQATSTLTANASRTLLQYVEILKQTAPQPIARQQDRIENLLGMIKVLSPENTLKRGYSVTRVDGKAVTDAAAVKPGSVIETLLAQGSLRSTVQ